MREIGFPESFIQELVGFVAEDGFQHGRSVEEVRKYMDEKMKHHKLSFYQRREIYRMLERAAAGDKA